MKMHVKWFGNPNRTVSKSKALLSTAAIVAAIGLSLTSCLDEPEGDWGGEPGTNPGNGQGSALNLAERLRVIHADAESNSEHVIELTGSGNIGAQSLSFAGRSNIIIRIMGDGRERTVFLTDNGTLFSIGAGVELILDNGVTLKGRSGNNAPLISVGNGGTLRIRAGAKVLENNNSAYSNGVGGVLVAAGGGFIMEGGEISGNSASGNNVGGVRVASGGNFSMENGKISGNTGTGVYVEGLFTMSNGEITYNTAQTGGGVYVSGGNFTMDGGKIFGNTATTTSTSSGGGGVYVSNATFTMNGGEIAFNSATSGGGVFVTNNAHIIKTGGTIYGYTMGDVNRNTATAGIANNDRGHAVFINSNPNKRRETTAGPTLNLDSNISGAGGGWE